MHYKIFIKPIVFIATFALTTAAMADSLKDAIESAMKLNPDVRFAATHRWTVEEQLKQQKAGYLPTLDLAAGEGLQNSNNPSTASLYSGDQAKLTRSESSLTLDQNLFAGFATKNEVHRLKESVKAAAYKAGGTAEDIALSATEQYLEVLRRQKLVGLAKDNLAIHKNLREMISQRAGAGISRTADLDQADGRLALASAGLIAERGNLIDAESSYQLVVGEAPQHLAQPISPPNAAIPATEAAAVQLAMAGHPTLQSANADIEAARAQHDTSKSNNYPHLDLVLSASRNRNLGGQPGVVNDDTAMVRGTWNLFKGGQDSARQRETAYQVQEAIDTRNRTLWQVQQAARLSWNAWQISGQRLHDLQKHRDLAKRAVAAYRDQFKLGQRTLLDLLNSENEYYQASVDYLTAQYTELYARYRVLNSMGKLMDSVGVARPAEASLKMPETARKGS
jgi:adhesin transport system outer membrane protein